MSNPNPRKNLPNIVVDEIPKEFIGVTVNSLIELGQLGKCKSDQEVAERIGQFFEFCGKKDLRPGIESLCVALNISRKTLFAWGEGRGCSPERTEIVRRAKGLINAFLEQTFTNGKLNPAAGIFLLKNWCDYKDSISFETTEQAANIGATMTATEIAQRHQGATLPEMPDFSEN